MEGEMRSEMRMNENTDLNDGGLRIKIHFRKLEKKKRGNIEEKNWREAR